MTKQRVILLFLIWASCGESQHTKEQDNCSTFSDHYKGSCIENCQQTKGALLASRVSSLSELKTIVKIDYFNQMVRLAQCSSGKGVVSILKEGISQTDIINAKNGGLWDKIAFVVKAPQTVADRVSLSNIYILSRRRNDLFGWGDVAFYDLALAAEKKIITEEIAYKTVRDSSEKGYINSFNHITAQAIITSCYSEEMADFVADAHELYNMPELTTGAFTKEQLTDPNTNPVDNYVDMVNNEWGQEIGKKLKKKYNLSNQTQWTPKLLADYLNDIQSYYSWAYQIGMEPFRSEEDIVVKFSKKLKKVLKGTVKMQEKS